MAKAKEQAASLADRLKELPRGLKESEAKRKLEWTGDDAEFREAFLNDYLGVSVKRKGKANGE